ncbi:hypothetical protein [Tessaracoccus coleopterorum]|uniref:hypothetical protein n=1 Tax=Tessaracoccus coleopterorum TaxID=2714950 RepID=UPI002F9152FE
MELTAVLGDITRQRVDAIVNAANNAMRGAAESTGRSTAPEAPLCSRTASPGSPTGWRPVTPAGR